MNEPAYVRSSKQWWTLGGATFTVVILLIMAIIVLVKQRRKSRRQAERLRALYNQLMGQSSREYLLEPVDPKHPLHERIEQLPYDRRFEINKERLVLKQVFITCK